MRCPEKSRSERFAAYAASATDASANSPEGFADALREHARSSHAADWCLPKGEVNVVAKQLDEMLRQGQHSPEHAGTPLAAATFTNEDGDCKA